MMLRDLLADDARYDARFGAVAIVGIACRFPGAADHSAFWRNLCEGVESISALSDDDLVSAGVPAELLRDPSYVKAAALLPDIYQFDAAFFEYSPQEARLMDPQQRLLLEVAWEAFEDAGQPVGSVPRPIGVFTGVGGVVSSYLVDRLPFSADMPGTTGNLTHLGNDKDFPSTRISYKLNLTGPSINVQTACSTSLVAVSSPRATDPKTRTFLAPERRNTSRSIFRFRRRSRPRGAVAERTELGTGSASSRAFRASCRPHARSSRSRVGNEGRVRPLSYRAMADCEVPARAASSACVRSASRRALLIRSAGCIGALYLFRYTTPHGPALSPTAGPTREEE